MKKLSFFLMAMLFSVMSFAAEVTETVTMKGFAGLSTSAYENVTKTGASDKGTAMVAYAFNPSTGQVRGNKTQIAGASVTSKDDAKNWSLYNVDAMAGAIKSIKITCAADGSNYFKNNMYVALGTSSQGAVTTISGAQKNTTASNAEFTFDIDATKGYTYFKLLSNEKFTSGSVKGVVVTITYEAADNYVAVPSITGETYFKENTTVTLTASEGQKVYYTLDGTEPTNASTEYTAPFELTETTTVKAIAYQGENASEVAEQVFKKMQVLTCAEAAAITPNGDKYIVRGYVTKANEYSAQYNNIDFFVADTKDGGEVLKAYRAIPVTEEDKAVKEGDYVEIIGVLSAYNGTVQVAQGGTYTIIPEPTPEPEHTYTVAGSSATVFGTAWNANDTVNNMTKQEDGTYKLEKTELTLAAGTIEFKVVEDHNWDIAYPADNYKLTIAEDGIYTITITFNPADKAVAATTTKTGDVGKIIPTIAMHGNFLGSWADTENFTLAADEATATLTLTIAEGNYEFGVRIDGTWTSNGVAFTRENASAKIVSGSGNLKLAADVAGEYTFTWTFETNTLTVTYPALVTAIEVKVTDATATSGEWSIDLAGSWNDQALTIKLWQDNTQGFGSYAPNTETGYYILLGAKELTPTTEGVYADNGDGTFTFTCSATDGTTQYNITVTGTSGAQEVYYETFVLTNLEVTDNETFLVLSASDMTMGLEVTLGVNTADATLMDASEILFGGEVLPILSSEPVTVTFNEELLTDVYTARVVVEHMGQQLGLELIMYAGTSSKEPVTIAVTGAVASVANDGWLVINGTWNELPFMLKVAGYEDTPFKEYTGIQVGEMEYGVWEQTDADFGFSDLVTVIKTGDNLDVMGEFTSIATGTTYNVSVSASFAAGPETGVDNINTTVAPVKVIENGQIFIISNGVKYNAQGAQL